MSDKDYIKELFSEKLKNYEAKVNPELWNSISTQIGATTAASSGGMTLLTKWMIGVASVGVITTGVVWYVNQQQVETGDSQKTAISTPISDSVEKAVQNNETVEETSSQASTAQEVQRVVTDEVIVDETFEVQAPKVLTQSNSEPNEIILPPETIEEGPVSIVFVPEKSAEIVQESLEEKPDERLQETPEEKEHQEVVTESKESETYKIGSLPNAFTPNGDRENDVFFIHCEGLFDFNLVVLNTKHQIVYESKNPDFHWDGTDKYGSPVPDGRYIYYITARDASGNPVNKYSELLIRR